MNEFPLAAGREVLLPVLEDPEPAKRLIAAKCIGLLAGYDAQWREAPYLINEVECVLTSDLFNPATERKSRTFTLAGKIDVRATEKESGNRVIFDHKTTSDGIDDPDSDYWRQLVVEGQVDQYMLLEWLNGNKVDLAIWDCVRKPGISPKALSKKETAALLSGTQETYFGYKLTAYDGQMLESLERETHGMYAGRLAHDCTVERSNWYFQRRSVPRIESEILEYAADVWDHAQFIITMRQSKRYPRISKACMLHHSACAFLGLCSKHDSLDSGNWTEKAWVHPELPVLNGRGTEILTNSRLQSLICPQKHYLQYELGVEKVTSEEREALWFGNLFHEALERYFLEIKRQQNGGKIIA
jgi:hypothetical protein